MSGIKINPGFLDELKLAARPVLVAAAQAARSHVEEEKHSIMPRRRTGSVVVDFNPEGVQLINTDYGAHLDEYGSVNNPAYAPMRRGVRAAGLRLNEHGR